MTGKTGTEEFEGIDWEKTQKGADWRRGKGKGIRGERGGEGKKQEFGGVDNQQYRVAERLKI